MPQVRPRAVPPGRGWKVHAELLKPVNFDAYSQFAREVDVAQLVPCGSAADGIAEGVKQFVDARFDRVALER